MSLNNEQCAALSLEVQKESISMLHDLEKLFTIENNNKKQTEKLG